MSPEEGKILHISDTALMVAACRALETARPDGFVRDPFAERLAGARGMAIALSLPRMEVMCFGVGVRSRCLDELLMESIRRDAITAVISVGCGLDTRPWRLDLPADLRWIEVDLPALLDYKAGAMAGEKPKCRVGQIPADLNDPSQRQAAFSLVAAAPALMITEGLLMYLSAETVEALASEPPRISGVRFWLTDVTSPVFARNVGMDTYKDVQDMRDPRHLDGAQILDTLHRHGWSSIRRRSYLTDIWEFAGNRLRAAYAARAGAPPPEPVPRDDPTGVHLFGLT